MATPQSPIVAAYSAQLRSIRALFLDNQLRHCIQACQETLDIINQDGAPRPVQKTFALFYLACAHDQLARAMHPHSISKLPALKAAEGKFLDALQTLPAAENAHALCSEMIQDDAESPTDGDSEDELEHRYDFGPPSWPSIMGRISSGSCPSLPTTQDYGLHAGSIPDSHHPSALDEDDLDSHRSFDQIMTPNRKLARDFSQMSLLETLAVPEAQRPLSHAGLMRPIRLGSPPKIYRLPRIRTQPALVSATSHPPASSLRALPLRIATAPNMQPTVETTFAEEPVAVSPLAWTDHHHHDPFNAPSPVSPMSSTGEESGEEYHSVGVSSPEAELDSGAPPSPEDVVDPATVGRVAAHLAALRLQLEMHLALAQQAKQQALVSRAPRSVADEEDADEEVEGRARALPPAMPSPVVAEPGNKRETNAAKKVPTGSALPATAARTYRLSTPDHVRRKDLQTRIEKGRATGWARVPFEPGKYQLLAEHALEELGSPRPASRRFSP